MHIPHTKRLSFHFVTLDDAEFLWSVDQDEAVMKYINGGKKTSMETIREQFIPRIRAFSDELKGWGLWRVSALESPQEDLGWILVRPFGFFTGERDDNNLELGWRFHRNTWGKGIATEAAAQVKQALYVNGTNQFSAIALPDNKASVNVMEKLGMTFSHRYLYSDAVFNDEVVVYRQTLLPAKPVC